MKEQILEEELEGETRGRREHGVNDQARAVRMPGPKRDANNTSSTHRPPGHVDFNYEVSRSHRRL